jgi:hypothetical protein
LVSCKIQTNLKLILIDRFLIQIVLSSEGSYQNETWSMCPSPHAQKLAHQLEQCKWSFEAEQWGRFCCLLSCSASFLHWLGDRSSSCSAIAGSSSLSLGLKTVQAHWAPTLSPPDPALLSPPLFLSIFCPVNRTAAAEHKEQPHGHLLAAPLPFKHGMEGCWGVLHRVPPLVLPFLTSRGEIEGRLPRLQ